MEAAIRLVVDAERVAVLTGAGISTSAGLPDYRSAGGRWASGDADRASREHLYDHPAEAWRWWVERYESYLAVKPTAAHRLIRRLEDEGRIRGVITQNIDGLHRRAGSIVVELHGSLLRSRCTYCDWHGPTADIARERRWRCRRCGQARRPDVVLFGEAVEDAAWATAREWVEAADLLLVLGTTLPFPPSNRLPALAVQSGGRVITVDRTGGGAVGQWLRADTDEWASALADELDRRVGSRASAP